jgi:LmbE family N-acetylglucosaminyl deacetylase
LFEADEPDHLEDVSEFVDLKLAALLEHKSQLRSTMGIADGAALEDRDHSQVQEFRRRVTDRLAEQGEKGGFAAAEAFKRIDNL